ncbi:thioredoxin-disulfide reductase [Acidobacteria bacterium AH-259-D05]|nr:thioredoxin-disulfide reductase [Acidobacteria bacterium AH-259-D05]
MVHKVIILGSGCAGSTAAIYAARADLEPLVLEGHEPGGQLSLTTDVENYPGFPDGIQGPDLVVRMKEQAQRFGAIYEMEVVEEADLSQPPFQIKTGKSTYETQSLIIASGASARLLGLPSEGELIGHGVSTCATCDGYFFRDQKIIVVGGGDTAMEESLFLTKFAEKVSVVHRRDELRASKIMAERALNHPKIEFIWDSLVTEILDPQEKKVQAVKLKNVKTGEEQIHPIDGVFIAIGHEPNTKPFEGQLDMNDQGYIVVHDGSKTSVEGVFAAGDVHDHVYRQAVTAAGSGCQAAIDAEKYLQEQGATESKTATGAQAGVSHP